ncbi:MAG: aminodeoxychorismate synthase component I [Saprospiraceae bacterium]
MDKKSAIHTMNTLCAEGKPFLFVIDFELVDIQVIPLYSPEHSGILFDVEGLRNYDQPIQISGAEFLLNKNPLSKREYGRGFEIVQKGLHRGDSFLVNLTYPTPIDTNLSLKEIFYRSKAKYKLLYKDKFVCFSPEIFVKINESGQISSYPMKGTIDAGIENAERQILENKKEKAEHNTIVDLIRNDLSKVAREVSVKRYRYIDKLLTHGKTLLQVSSEISGQLTPDWRDKLGDILFELLPAGSITGAPKNATLKIIDAAEKDKRGFYTGIFGVFDGYTLDSSVMIRFIEQDENGNKTFRSGGGITVFSDVDSEYQELIDKVYLPIY